MIYEQKDSSAGASFDSLNSSLFTVDQADKTFTKLITDASLADTYEIRYRAELDYYNVESDWSDPIVYENIDPCAITVPDDYAVDYEVNSNAKTVDYTVGFQVAETAEMAILHGCGPIEYTLDAFADTDFLY